SAFSANVSPSSGGSSTSRPSASISMSPPRFIRRSNSRRLCSLWVASSSLIATRNGRRLGCDGGRRGGDRLLLDGAQRGDPALGQHEQLVQVGAGERGALAGRLELDESALAGHHDV